MENRHFKISDLLWNHIRCNEEKYKKLYSIDDLSVEARKNISVIEYELMTVVHIGYKDGSSRNYFLNFDKYYLVPLWDSLKAFPKLFDISADEYSLDKVVDIFDNLIKERGNDAILVHSQIHKNNDDFKQFIIQDTNGISDFVGHEKLLRGTLASVKKILKDLTAGSSSDAFGYLKLLSKFSKEQLLVLKSNTEDDIAKNGYELNIKRRNNGLDKYVW